MEDENAGAVQDDYSSEPARSSKPYLDAIAESEKAFEPYQTKADKIDKLYADLERQANIGRDREFAMFWANIEVLKPSIYARPPVPVVVPRFKDRRPVPRTASELLERATVVAFDLGKIDRIMRLVRDDLAIQARGVAWVRYEAKDGKQRYGGQRVCIEHVHRRDFLHGLARNWTEVPWVARRAWLTKDEMEERFGKTSAGAWKDAEYMVQKDDRDRGAADSRTKAGVWEIWHKDENKVIWVTPGVDVVLDEGEPHLELEGFFPCPQPAYGTTQRDSLVPVPDMLFYKDQLEEINELTARIATLSEAVKVRGFYPAGAGEIGDAIEAAIKATSNNTIMIPISNWAAFGSGSAKDTVIWLPLDMIATTIAQLVELRRQLIEDVYQITGLSDIMRGATDPNETLGAQQLKSQYGSVRIRDRQSELVRVAQELAHIAGEIMAENFSTETLLEMSQMEIKTEADLKQEVEQVIAQSGQQIQQQLQQMVQQQLQQNPEAAEQAQADPQAAQQMLAQLQQQLVAQAEPQVQAQIEKINQQPTVEKVMRLLRDQRLRPFILEIETDSTIQPDEDAEKQRRAEFLTSFGAVMQQLAPMVQAEPSTATFAGEVLKFAVAPFRIGRQLDASIDEFVEQMKAKASQPQPNPEAEKAKAEMAMKEKELQGQMQIEQMKLQAQQAGKAEEQQMKLQEIQAERDRDAQKHQQEMEKGDLELKKLQVQIEAMRVKAMADQQAQAVKIATAERQAEIAERSAVQKAEIEAATAEQKAQIHAQQAEQKAALAERAAMQKQTEPA